MGFQDVFPPGNWRVRGFPGVRWRSAEEDGSSLSKADDHRETISWNLDFRLKISWNLEYRLKISWYLEYWLKNSWYLEHWLKISWKTFFDENQLKSRFSTENQLVRPCPLIAWTNMREPVNSFQGPRSPQCSLCFLFINKHEFSIFSIINKLLRLDLLCRWNVPESLADI